MSAERLVPPPKAPPEPDSAAGPDLTGRDRSALADRVDFFLALRSGSPGGQPAGSALAAMTDA
jgi:hypothetical protein